MEDCQEEGLCGDISNMKKPSDTTEGVSSAPIGPSQESRISQDLDEDFRRAMDLGFLTTHQALEEVSGKLERHLADCARYSRTAFDRLYDEMQGYKHNFILELLERLLKDIIIHYDSIDGLATFYERGCDEASLGVASMLRGLQSEVKEILTRQGIERMEGLVGGKYDWEKQTAVAVVSTEEASEDADVIERRKSGFLNGEKVFRKEQVIIKRFQTPSKEEART